MPDISVSPKFIIWYLRTRQEAIGMGVVGAVRENKKMELQEWEEKSQSEQRLEFGSSLRMCYS